MAIAKDSLQGLIDQGEGTERGAGLAGKGIIDLVLESGAVGGVGEAVSMGTAGKGTPLLDIPEQDPGYVFDMARMPVVGHGAGLQLQHHRAARFDGAWWVRTRVSLPGRDQSLQSSRAAVPVVELRRRAGEERGEAEVGGSVIQGCPAGPAAVRDSGRGSRRPAGPWAGPSAPGAEIGRIRPGRAS